MSTEQVPNFRSEQKLDACSVDIREKSKFIRFGKEDEQCPFAMPLPKDCSFTS